MKAKAPFVLIGLVLCGVAGCHDPRERFGRVWYLGGAGNWGFGVGDVLRGLEKAGYPGYVTSFHWSLTMSPIADQILKPLMAPGAARLAANIDEYLDRYPNNEVHIIALSAGTGVAVRAVEHLKPGHQIQNMYLIGSSLSCNYDMSKALPHIRGKVYVYYSNRDGILAGPARLFGTIGGSGHDEPAGLVGLRHPSCGDKVVNIGWSPRYAKYGWTGGHVTATSEKFVQFVMAPTLMPKIPPTALAAARERGATHMAGRTGLPSARSGSRPRPQPAGRPRIQRATRPDAFALRRMAPIAPVAAAARPAGPGAKRKTAAGWVGYRSGCVPQIAAKPIVQTARRPHPQRAGKPSPAL